MPRRIPKRPPPVDISDKGELLWSIVTILAAKVIGLFRQPGEQSWSGIYLYLADWYGCGWGEESQTWEPVTSFKNCPHLLLSFEEEVGIKYPQHPGKVGRVLYPSQEWVSLSKQHFYEVVFPINYPKKKPRRTKLNNQCQQRKTVSLRGKRTGGKLRIPARTTTEPRTPEPDFPSRPCTPVNNSYPTPSPSPQAVTSRTTFDFQLPRAEPCQPQPYWERDPRYQRPGVRLVDNVEEEISSNLLPNNSRNKLAKFYSRGIIEASSTLPTKARIARTQYGAKPCKLSISSAAPQSQRREKSITSSASADSDSEEANQVEGELLDQAGESFQWGTSGPCSSDWTTGFNDWSMLDSAASNDQVEDSNPLGIDRECLLSAPTGIRQGTEQDEESLHSANEPLGIDCESLLSVPTGIRQGIEQDEEPTSSVNEPNGSLDLKELQAGLPQLDPDEEEDDMYV